MKKQNKIKIIISGIILAITLQTSLVSFALAVTAPQPGAIPNLTSAEILAADVDFAACQTFSTRVNDFYKAAGRNFYAKLYPKAGMFSLGDNVPAGLQGFLCNVTEGETYVKSSITTESRAEEIKIRANAKVGGIGLDAATITGQSQLNDTGAAAAKGVMNVFGWVISAIIDVFVGAVAALAKLAGEILSVVVTNITHFSKPQLVDVGWTIVRDFLNLFFILALIVIAIGTILRIEAYNYKKLLVQLILMALLVNFSKAIAYGLIDFFDVLIQLVAGPNPSFFDWTVFMNAQAPEWSLTAPATAGGGWASNIINSLLALVLVTVIAVAFIAISLMLVIRIVGLWFLVIISPVAYALNILPQTKKFASQWWSKFFQYLIWAPVAIFFLRLGNRMVQAKVDLGSVSGNVMFDNVLIGAFIWSAIIVSKNAGMIGAGAIISVAEKSAAKYGKMGPKFVGSYFARGTAARNAGSIAGALAGGQYTRLGRGLQAAGTATGDRIGKATAYAQALPKAVGANLKRYDDARTNEIKKKASDLQVGGKYMFNKLRPSNEEETKNIKARHVETVFKTANKKELAGEVGNMAAYGGREVADAMVLNLKKGMLDKVGKEMGEKEFAEVKETIVKNYFVNRGVREHEFLANKDQYMEGYNKAEPVKVGSTEKVNVDMNSIKQEIKKQEDAKEKANKAQEPERRRAGFNQPPPPNQTNGTNTNTTT